MNGDMELNSLLIKRKIRQLGLKQEDFAVLVGLRRGGLQYVLNRKSTTMDTLSRIARVLGVDPKELLV